MENEPTSSGALQSVRRIVRVLMGTLRNRVELFVVEWQEERYRVISLMLLAGGALVFGLVALLLGTAVIIFLFAPEHRIYVAAALAVIYVALGSALLVRMRQRLRDQPFTESIDQIKKDWECLTPPK